jgi:hypothetical protein
MRRVDSSSTRVGVLVLVSSPTGKLYECMLFCTITRVFGQCSETQNRLNYKKSRITYGAVLRRYSSTPTIFEYSYSSSTSRTPDVECTVITEQLSTITRYSSVLLVLYTVHCTGVGVHYSLVSTCTHYCRVGFLLSRLNAACTK